MIKAEPICPILQLSINYLTSPQDIMLYVLRHYIYTPKGINDTFNTLEKSLVYSDALLNSDKIGLANKIKKDLVFILNRYFPDYTPIVNVEFENESGSFFNIKIQMEITIDGNFFTTENVIQIDKKSKSKIILENDGEFKISSI